VARNIKGGSYKEATVEVNDLPSDVAYGVFQLSAGQNTHVIESDGAYSIYQVVKIIPEAKKTLPQVAEQLKEDIRLHKSAEFLQEFKNKIEDSLAAGTDLSKVAEDHKLPIEVLTLDDQGKDSGKSFEKLSPEIRKIILENAFALSEGKETPILDVDGHTSLIVRVDKVTQAFVPELQTIRSRVLQDATDEQKQENAHKLALKIAKEAKNLAELARLANTHNLPLVSDHTISLMDMEKEEGKNTLRELVTPDLQDKAFQLAVDQATQGPHPSGKGMVVVMLQKIIPTAFDEKGFATFEKALTQMIEKEAASMLMEILRKKYPVVIDEKVLNHLLKND
jgi:parvulin-like peptidyl-prolyl isomerase